MRLDGYDALVLGVFASLLGFVIWICWSAHRHDGQLEAECQALGGQLIHARSPMHACVPVLTDNAQENTT